MAFPAGSAASDLLIFARMPDRHANAKRPHGWMGIHRGHKARPLEWLAEKLIFLVSLSTILVVFLIFVFLLIGRLLGFRRPAVR